MKIFVIPDSPAALKEDEKTRNEEQKSIEYYHCRVPEDDNEALVIATQ